MRLTLPAATMLIAAFPLSAQLVEAPANLATVEINRSRQCVTTLAEIAVIDEILRPIAIQSQRFTTIARAIAIEDASIVPSLNTSDPFDSAIADWFATDELMARRFIETQAPVLQEQRTTGREAIKIFLTDAALAVQARADSVLAENENTVTQAASCDGAIFVRPAVLEACETGSGEICIAAAQPPAATDRFRFVDAPESVWDVQEFRPWTDPTTIQLGPTGQLEGARTVAFTRVGNVVVTVAFSPLLRDVSDVTPAERFSFDQTNQALGLSFNHPSILFAPGFAIRAALPEPLAGEDEYVIHFGDPTEPDALWTGPASTGSPMEASIPLEATHVIRLREGHPLSLTAMRDGESEYSIPLYSTNQAIAMQALLSYMSNQLSVDLNEFVKPVG
ncbi:MAG: hypothetical protein OSA81_12525 [Longimicrobiales bacterium]|nr:hypothetical protein [Longimicrobiales bacterium]